MFKVLSIMVIASVCSAPAPNPHIIAAAAPITYTTYSTYGSPYVVSSYVSPYSLAYNGLGKK